ncbi:MAG: DUF4330 domain-containing protein [Tissierellia bacterium]|nr:DUF4330 domain-containing protein [Tissierellia bacterium]
MKKRFNMIDLGLIALVILGLFLYFNRDKVKDLDKDQAEGKKVHLVCVVEDVHKSAFDQLAVGDQLFAEYQDQPGYITSIDLEPYKKVEVGSDGKLYEVVHQEDHVKATVGLEAQVDYDGPYMQLGGQEVKAGLDYILKTEDFASKSRIVTCEVVE